MNLKIHLHLQSQGTAIECFDLAHVTCNILACEQALCLGKG